MLDNNKIAEFVRAATGDVFSTMLGLNIEAGEARVEQESPGITDGVFAFVGMAGGWTGSGTISCSASFACLLCAQLLSVDEPAVNEEVLDAVGEITNMIIGNFKTLAEELVGPLGLSIPTVIYGRNFTSRSLGRNDWVALPFTCEGGVLEVRVCLAPSKPPTMAHPGPAQHCTVLS
jgi:chemotaxis protein CheX